LQQESIHIKQAIVHVIDSNLSMPVLSDVELSVNGEIGDFIRAHLCKILSGDDFKICEFMNENSKILELLKQFDETSFIDVSKSMARQLYEIIMKNVDIPSADILIVYFEADGERFIALLKMNYKSAYIHLVQTLNSEINNSIIKQKTVLPSENQKLDEAFIINLNDYSIKLIEKKYEINGVKEYYLSKYFLECKWDYSSKEKLSMLTKTVDKISKKYYYDDIEKKIELKKTLFNEYEEKGSINIEEVADSVFKSNVVVKEEFKNNINKYGINDTRVTFQSKSLSKRFERQLIKTDTGIEINIPVEQYGNKDVLEFITNHDGTISILIKNITKLTG